MDEDRRGLLRLLGIGLVAAAAVGEAHPAAAQPDDADSDPLRLLADGNGRFAAGEMAHPNQDPARRARVAAGDVQPFATVFSCVDSRTPPEILFDRGLGDLFVVRTVALDYPTLARDSLEYGPVTDATRLLVVLGHQRCATVTAAVETLESGTTPPADLAPVVRALRPAYLVAKASQPRGRAELIDATTVARTRLAVGALRADPTLAHRVSQNRLRIRGAWYSLDSGVVSWPDY